MVLTEYDEERHITNEKKISREEGREEGRLVGMEEGQALKLISQIRRKSQKGQSSREISEDLLESQELIDEIFTLLKNNPQVDDQQIYKKWKA